MLCTLVIAIGTFPYALRVVTTPWSLDQDKYHETCDSREVVTCKVPPDDFVVDSVYARGELWPESRLAWECRSKWVVNFI